MRFLISLAIAVALPVPYLLIRASGRHIDPTETLVATSLSMVGTGLLFVTAAVLIQKQAPKLIKPWLLGVLACLPQAAIGFSMLSQGPAAVSAAQITVGEIAAANRLVLGVGLTIATGLLHLRQRRRVILLERGQLIDLTFIALATLYSLTIPIRGAIGIADLLVLAAVFIFYLMISYRGHASDRSDVPPLSDLLGKSSWFGPVAGGVCAVYAAATTAISVEPFTTTLLTVSGSQPGGELLSPQWIAAMVAGAPTLALTLFFGFGGASVSAIQVSLASKIGFSTIGIGLLPLFYSLSPGGSPNLPIDQRLAEELLLTAAQSLFALALLAGMRIRLAEGLAVFGLFFTQLLFQEPDSLRIVFSVFYCFLAFSVMVIDPVRIRILLRGPGELLRLATKGQVGQLLPAAQQQSATKQSRQERRRDRHRSRR